jgi:hypothetical protein
LIELPTLTNKWNFSKRDLIDSLVSRLEFCSNISAPGRLLLKAALDFPPDG